METMTDVVTIRTMAAVFGPAHEGPSLSIPAAVVSAPRYYSMSSTSSFGFSGKSSPCLSMEYLCSISLSFCFRSSIRSYSYFVKSHLFPSSRLFKSDG